jgi:glycosyltransferase involved in cell wall biosynthesis/GT2 family glycosyltransferase
MEAGSGSGGGAGSRPAVSVVMPFRGDAEEAREAMGALSVLRTRPGDELIFVDNGATGKASSAEAGRDERIRVVAAGEVASSYYARNAGAGRASASWLLFLDSDCRPGPDLLDAFFREAVPADWGAIAGDVLVSEDGSLLGGWAASRGVLRQEGLPEGTRPAAVSANLMVRREAWQGLGGFLEGVRSGGDVEFCWRLQDAGWKLGFRPSASVEHPHRGTLRELIRQMGRYGAGNAWLRRRYGEAPLRRLDLVGILRGVGGALVWLLALQPRRSAYKAIDAIAIAAGQLGYLRSNGPRWQPPPPGGLVVLADSYATSTETFVANEVGELAAQGETVRVESIVRPTRQLAGAAGFGPVAYLEDEGPLARLGALLWLLARHPLGALRDLWSRRAWDPADRTSLSALSLAARRLARAGDRHLHAHFATASAVSAQRLGRLRRVPYSVTAHGFDIWVEPRNLPEKLRPAAFVTSGCEYNVRHLSELLGPGAAARVHEVVMGVDPERFRPPSSHPPGRTVAAVGRLVEKKGFAFLIEAAASLDPAVLERVLIAGDGPLRSELERLADARGVADRIDFLGGLDPAGVRRALESADLLAMPCVVAADGDRDSMPVVVKEAMAMEIPVVASDEVGLGEAVGPDRGRLVRPGDAASLAAAIEEILGLPADQRAALGRAGRQWVIRNATLELQAARVRELIGTRESTAR